MWNALRDRSQAHGWLPLRPAPTLQSLSYRPPFRHGQGHAATTSNQPEFRARQPLFGRVPEIFSKWCQLCHAPSLPLAVPAMAFSLHYRHFSPRGAPVRVAKSAGRLSRNCDGRLLGWTSPPCSVPVSHRSVFCCKDAAPGIRPARRFGHQDRRIQPHGRKNVSQELL